MSAWVARCWTLAYASALAVGCGPKVAPLLNPAQDSPAYKALVGRVEGYLERDLNHDGTPDAVFVERSKEGGFVVVTVLSELAGERWRWRAPCAPVPLRGEEVMALRWLGDAHVMARAVASDPDEQMESFVVVEPGGACAPVVSERVVLPLMEARVLRPPGPSVGVFAEEGVLWVLDEPAFLRVAGRGGEVAVLASVRQRRFVLEEGAWHTERRDTLRPLPVRVTLRVGLDDQGPDAIAGDARALASGITGIVGDRNERSTLVLLPAQPLHVHLSAEAPLVLVALHHGCTDTVGSAPRAWGEGGVQPLAVGLEHVGEEGERRSLWAFDAPAPREVGITWESPQAARCVREVHGFGFVEGL